jgi:predicted TIM-barrel fold metal-dependent hydrolase
VIVDAHVHFWDPRRFEYDWLPAELRRPVLPSDYGDGELIFVEADCRDPGELAWAESLGAAAGIVAYMDDLDALALRPRVVGVRHVLQGEARFDRFAPQIERAGELGLVFDACVRQEQLPQLTALARACPGTTIVLDHLGKPHAPDPWRAELARLAELPNVCCKLSGMEAELGPGWTEPQVRPYLEHALAVFGEARCLYGSDWPLTRDHERWRAAVRDVAPGTLDNARAVYGL